MLIAIGLSACTRKPFTGRIVEKEYIAGHRCHTEGYKVNAQAGIIVPHVAAHPVHHHKWEPAKVIVWVANRREVRPFSVDTLSFDKWVIGTKVTFR